MRKILLFIATLTLILGCKKEEQTSEYWDDKAASTYNEILSLSTY